MKSRFILMSTAWSLLAFGCQTAIAANTPFHAPATAHAYQVRAVLERAARALQSYIALCKAHDREELMHVVTRDLTIEHLPANGRAQPAEAAARTHPCASARALSVTGQLADLWIFPTDSADTVIAEFKLLPAERRAGLSRDHLLLLVMRGGRIARLRVFVPTFLRATAHKRLMADLSSMH